MLNVFLCVICPLHSSIAYWRLYLKCEKHLWKFTHQIVFSTNKIMPSRSKFNIFGGFYHVLIHPPTRYVLIVLYSTITRSILYIFLMLAYFQLCIARSCLMKIPRCSSYTCAFFQQHWELIKHIYISSNLSMHKTQPLKTYAYKQNLEYCLEYSLDLIQTWPKLVSIDPLIWIKIWLTEVI